MSTKVYIDASSSIPYGSFYIEGLKAIYGNKNVLFSKKYFNDGFRVGWNIRLVIASKMGGEKVLYTYK